ncbi:metaxin-1-like [Mercenaria mercenaria]|uniref:metaxin-1-like n=1 Tax=Mercenaria mercenaria TaxID=6596 RepID=UPI00234EC6FA|nr:metaxin-1-like [Mercenaria mercenaria]
MEDNIVHLNVWGGDWDLPSVDPNCLAALAYCRFSGVPVKVHKNTSPWKSPSGNFPWLRHNDNNETKVANIFSYLRKQNWGSDFNLSTKESADVVAYMALLEEKLLPGLLHLWWLESETYSNITRPWYTRATPFPFKLWLPGTFHSKAEKRVYVAQGTENITEADIDTKIYNDAKICLSLLSAKLGDKEYFFGNLPSSLDALVFGYVAPLLNAPLNSNQVTTHLRSNCDNLCILCTRITREFFPLSQEEMEAKHKEEQRKKDAESDSQEFPNRKRNMVLAGVFAVTTMVTYAFVSGLIRLEVIDDDDPLS